METLQEMPPRELRWANEIWAHIKGYFWHPCPQCGRFFGGHEMGWDSCAYVDDLEQGGSFGICPWCADACRGRDE